MAEKPEHWVNADSVHEVDEGVYSDIERSLARYARDPSGIDARLDELDREWDIERAVEVNAAGMSIVGLLLGKTVDRRFFMLPAVVAGFLMQHALMGWCPPVPLLRRYGYRTRSEIDLERHALKYLRGDYAVWAGGSGPEGEARQAMDSAAA